MHRPQETGCPRIDNSPLVESPEAVHNDDYVPTCSTLLSGAAKRIRRCGCRFLIVFLPVLLQKNTFLVFTVDACNRLKPQQQA